MVTENKIEFQQSWQTIKYVDVFNAKYLPPHSDLLLWRSRLGDTSSDTGSPYVHSDHDNFSPSGVEDAIKLLDAKAIRDCVGQEVNWFRNAPKLPRSAPEHPSN